MQLHYKMSGQGRAVMLLHGLLGSSDNWHPLALRLAASFQVFALDLRNHGRSPHALEMDYSLMAGDVEEFLIEHRIANVMVIGHSMGGKTAMQFALQFPHRVDKLVVADMAPRAYAPVHHKIFNALLALDLSAFSTRMEMEAALARDIPDLVLRRFLLKNLGRDAAGGYYWRIPLRALSQNYPQLCKPIGPERPFAKPALFLRGGSSNYVNAGDAGLIHELFPRAEMQTIQEAGHWIHGDQPEEVFRRLIAFL